MQDANLFKALANENRLAILEWLKDPTAHFRPQVDGDLIEDGAIQSPSDQVSKLLRREELESVLNQLTDRERKVLELRFGLRGVLWYQGESNTGEADAYAGLLRTYRDDLRAHFGKDLPLLVVQLAG